MFKVPRLLAASALGLGISLVGAPALTAPALADSSTDNPGTYTVTLTDQPEQPDGSSFGRPVVYNIGDGTVAPSYSNGGDNWGGSTASGCRTVTVYFDKNSPSGGQMFQYNESTHFCWNRANNTINDVKNNWWLSEMGSNVAWDGNLWVDKGFYNWSGGPSSGYQHRRQGEFEITFPTKGTIAYDYVTLELWCHKNGSWSWRVKADA